jgi:hypothetical protein
MKKIFQLVVVSALSAGALLQAAESGVVIARADRSASVKRGDVVAPGSTINVAGGTVRGSAFPGADFTLSGKDASLQINAVTINAQGGFVTQQGASLTLKSGDLISSVKRTDGVVTNYNVTIAGHGTISTELTQQHSVDSGIGVTDDNFAAACFQGVLYITFNHGVPLPGKPQGTKEGEPQFIVAVPSGYALVYNEFMAAGGQLVPNSQINGNVFAAILGAADEFQSQGAIEVTPGDSIPPGTISPSR